MFKIYIKMLNKKYWKRFINCLNILFYNPFANYHLIQIAINSKGKLVAFARFKYTR